MKFLIFLLILFCVGCSDVPDVEHYKAPKTHHGEHKQKAVGQNYGAKTADHDCKAGEIQWKTPSGWQETAGSGMRMVSFKKEGTDLDVSIVKLMGSAGGFVSNINRWRGQINLKDQTEKEVMKSLIQEKSPLSPFVWVKMENEGKGILAAIYRYSQETVFVKATANLDVLNAEQANFLALCKSLYPKQCENEEKKKEKY